MRYGQIERALVEALNVPPKRINAFRGRLRHLRNFGVPSIAWDGTGTFADYHREHALELMLALSLEAIGWMPKASAKASLAIARSGPADEGCVVFDQLPARSYLRLADHDAVWRWFEETHPIGWVFLDLSGIAADLDVALGLR